MTRRLALLAITLATLLAGSVLLEGDARFGGRRLAPGPSAIGVEGVAYAAPAGTGRLDLGVTDGYDHWVDIAEAARDGIRRYNAYFSWRDLEPVPGRYSLKALDEVIEEAESAGAKVALEIEITDVDCTEETDTDAKCFRGKLPRGIRFSRFSSSFDDGRFVKGLGRLVRRVMRRYDPRVLTHVFVGNEVDSYLRVVRDARGIDLFPGYANLIRKIRAEVHLLPKPRAKFGTALTLYAFPGYDGYAKRMAKVVDVLGFTIYPTDPDWGETTPIPLRVERWLDAARAVAGGRPIAITEIGASALAPFGTPESQAEFARAVIGYLKRHRAAFEYASWFSMYDNPALGGEFFEGTGLRTIDGTKRPAYDIWARQKDTPPAP